MMLVAGYFRIRDALPQFLWKYPLSYVAFHTYCVQASVFTIYRNLRDCQILDMHKHPEVHKLVFFICFVYMNLLTDLNYRL